MHFDRLRRREFITLLGGAAAAWPLAARAQQQAIPVIGFLHTTSADVWAPFVAALRVGLKEAGYVESRDILIEYRWAEDHPDKLPDLAADLVKRRVALIVSNTEGSLAAKAATATIPIVFTVGGDPVKLGLVTSLNRPGQNITGVNWFSTELMAKHLEIMLELVPQAPVIGCLINPSFPGVADQLAELERAAQNAGKRLRILNAGTKHEINTGFRTLANEQISALLVGPGPFFTAHREQIIALADSYMIPSIYTERVWPKAGGLMSYSSSATDAYRRAGIYAGRILKGEAPGNLPVDRSTKFELVINLETTRALGLDVPPTLLARADDVIGIHTVKTTAWCSD
jgi:putative ABC transport system substrate-binding protein